MAIVKYYRQRKDKSERKKYRTLCSYVVQYIQNNFDWYRVKMCLYIEYMSKKITVTYF